MATSPRQMRAKIACCCNLPRYLNRNICIVIAVLQFLGGATLIDAAEKSTASSSSSPLLFVSSSSRVQHRSQNTHDISYRRYPTWLRHRGGADTSLDEAEDDPGHQTSRHHNNESDANDSAVHEKSTDSHSTSEQAEEQTEESEQDKENYLSAETASTTIPRQTPIRRSAKRRRTSDMIQSLLERSFDSSTTTTIPTTNADQQEESNELRQLITERANELIQSLYDGEHQGQQQQQQQQQQHPKKLLHVLAPKIPAIHYSPNIMLRIQSAARSDMDAGIAACLLATLARVCELFDRHKQHRQQQQQSETTQEDRTDRTAAQAAAFHSSASEIISDRRFEQLVECVLCGLDVKRLLRDGQEPKRRQRPAAVDDKTADRDEHETVDDNIPTEGKEEGIEIIQTMLEHRNHGKIEEGLSLRDACRAAWGIAILGGHHYDSIGGENVLNIFLALSLRVSELLLAQLDRLCRVDLSYLDDLEDRGDDDRLGGTAEVIAEDAATAMWTFACVRACTGIRTVKLFETCNFILCQNPKELRRRFRATGPESNIGHENAMDSLPLLDIEPDDPCDNTSYDDKDATKDQEEEDAFLDWLSPNEITDMLWALALHGSSETYLSSKENVTLSETATKLREVAFDRLLYWLRNDLDVVRNNPQSKKLSDKEDDTPTVDTMNSTPGPEDEVVDSQDTVSNDVRIDNNSVDGAATGRFPSLGSTRKDLMQQAFQHISHKKHRFSSHDLCSIVWAVTELRDSLRFEIIELVTEIFAAQGPTATNHLAGGDLTNLVWALAKYATDREPATSLHSIAMLTTWAAQSALRRIVRSPDENKFDHDEVLRAFQPPELSRIVWSVASTFDACGDFATSKHRRDVGDLFQVALVVAGSHLSVFASEDLSRIAWAFLEACVIDDYLSNPNVLEALAKILITVESSIIRWEKGFCSLNEAETSKKVNESILFATFFGKSRTTTPLFDQRIGEVGDEEDDGIDYGTTRGAAKKSRLPLLRDLSVDPCTLCKVANAYATLSKSRPFVKGIGALTRIAVRLLASENGQLMKECSFHDIVRLLEAVATTEAFDRQSEFIARHFARRVVRMLNEELQQKGSQSAGFISKLSPTEKCVMLESLGKLGARFWSGDNDSKMAFKKLRIVMDDPLFDQAQLFETPTLYMVKLLHALVDMDATTGKRSFLLAVLLVLEDKVKEIRREPELCVLIESLGKLGQRLELSDLVQTSHLSEAVEDDMKLQTRAADVVNMNDLLDGHVEISEIELRRSCRRLLSKAASQSITLVPSMKVDEIRRILDLYTFLPVKEDDLFACIEEDLAERKRAWNQQSLKQPRALVRDSIELVQNLLSVGRDEDAGSPKRSFPYGMFFKDKTIKSSVPIPKIQEILNKLLMIDHELEGGEPSMGRSGDSASRDIQDGWYYGLCCCEELVAAYRRIEFTTGTHKSRYDKHRRRDIAKRVLSRLLPSTI